jgi:hypothetical protein
MQFRRHFLLILITFNLLFNNGIAKGLEHASIEWLAYKSELIVIGRVENWSKPMPEVGDDFYRVKLLLNINIDQTLKGQELPRISAVVECWPSGIPENSPWNTKEPVLFFLVSSQHPNVVKSKSDEPAVALLAPWASLDLDSRSLSYIPIKEWKRSVAKFFYPRIIQEGLIAPYPQKIELIPYIRTQVSRAEKAIGQHWINEVWEDDIRQQLWRHEYVMAIIDEYSRGWALAGADSDREAMRINAARILSHFNDRQSLAALRTLLDCPAIDFVFQYTERTRGAGKWTRYPISARVEAYRGLKRHGVAPLFPEIERAYYTVNSSGVPVRTQLEDPLLAGPAIPKAVSKNIYRIVGSSLILFCLTLLILKRLEILSKWIDIVSFTSLFLLLTSVLMLIRSRGHIDELAFPISREYRLEIASLSGQLRLLNLHWPEQMLPAYTSVIPDRWTFDDWNPLIQPRATSESWNRVGFSVGRGLLNARQTTCGQFAFISVPWWSMVFLFALLPTIRVCRRVRYFRRMQNGLCPHCGYDLHASPERCPECGKDVPKSNANS